MFGGILLTNPLVHSEGLILHLAGGRAASLSKGIRTIAALKARGGFYEVEWEKSKSGEK